MFIEMETVEQALKAKLFLNDKEILEDGTKITIHQSNHENLVLNDRSGGIS